MKRWIFFILPLLLYSEGNVLPLFIQESQEGYKPGNSLIQALLPLASYSENVFPKRGWADPNICKNLSFQPNPKLLHVAILPRSKPRMLVEASDEPIFNQLELVNSNEIALVMGPAPLSALQQVFGSKQKEEGAKEAVSKPKQLELEDRTEIAVLMGPAPIGVLKQVLRRNQEQEVSKETAVDSAKVFPDTEQPFPKEEVQRSNYPLPKRIELDHVEGWGAGANYGTNYSTLAILFGPDYKIGHLLPMADLRVHRFDNGTWAGSVGFVGRYIPDNFCELLGVNVYYDYRQGSIGQFHQVGLGLEILGKRWDFRANGYVPVSVTKHCNKCVFDDYDGGYFMIDKRIETVSYGYNAEVGYLFVRSDDFQLYGAAGPYYMTGRRCHEKTCGGKARIRPQYKDYLAVDLSATYDPVFKAVYQAEIIISLPLYQIKPQNKGVCGVTDRQIYQRVERFEVMPIGKCRCVKTNF